MKIVSNSGPILSFARAHHLDLLREVAGTLIIPEAARSPRRLHAVLGRRSV